MTQDDGELWAEVVKLPHEADTAEISIVRLRLGQPPYVVRPDLGRVRYGHGQGPDSDDAEEKLRGQGWRVTADWTEQGEDRYLAPVKPA